MSDDDPRRADRYAHGSGGVHGRRRQERPRGGRARRVLVEAAVLVAVLAGVAVGAVAVVANMVSNNIERLGDPFAALPTRPPVVSVASDEPEPVDILVMGLDGPRSARDRARWADGSRHADAIMLVHLSSDRRNLSVMSIPRDSWVAIPGHGEGEISTAFSKGGPGLVVQTVEQLTNIRIEHMVIADFESFARVTDALGGVTITIPATTYDASHGVVVPAGTYEMDGAAALRYVRQREGLPAGDLDRVQRQQNWVRALAREALEGDALENPVELTRVLLAVSESIAVDDGFTDTEMRNLALSLRAVRGADDTVFFTAPVLGGTTGAGQRLMLDPERLAAVSAAIAQDDVVQFLAENPGIVETLTARVD
jgi:LCP family protein required for cell wall assembly